MSEQSEKTGQATYSPEDNKLRLYIGRVPKPEYLKLKAEGWQALYKQRELGQGDFVATWTPARKYTALQYADAIEDEDAGPAERAADRAERFSGYRDKRTDDATSQADRFDNQPLAHGYQNEARAERAAAKHDRIGDRALDCWSKAEYWQRRTAGVIRNALHKSSPGVRMGRIKIIEAELRKERSEIKDRLALFNAWVMVRDEADPVKQTKAALLVAGSLNCWAAYRHPRPELVGDYHKLNDCSLYSLLTCEKDPISGAEAVAFFFSNHSEPRLDNEWTRHHELRLAYENQMLEAQGGRAAMVEMEVGGWIGNHQIRKVNKSNVTGRVVSVTLKIPGDRWGNTKEGFHFRPFNIERLSVDAYRPPTEEDKKAVADVKKAEKESTPEKAACPVINPTNDDAEKLQAIWNAAEHDPGTVLYMTQAKYSAYSKGTSPHCEIVSVSEKGTPFYQHWSGRGDRLKMFKVRKAFNGFSFRAASRVVVLTDKPQKPIPFKELEKARAKMPTVEGMRKKFLAILKEMSKPWDEINTEGLLSDAQYIGWIEIQSATQITWTTAGHAEMEAQRKAGALMVAA